MIFTKSLALTLLLLSNHVLAHDTHLRSLAEQANDPEAINAPQQHEAHAKLVPMFGGDGGDNTLEVSKFIVNLNRLGFTDETRNNAGGQVRTTYKSPVVASQNASQTLRKRSLTLTNASFLCHRKYSATAADVAPWTAPLALIVKLLSAALVPGRFRVNQKPRSNDETKHTLNYQQHSIRKQPRTNNLAGRSSLHVKVYNIFFTGTTPFPRV